MKSNEKPLLIERQQFFRCSQSTQLSTYDSGFVDEQNIESITTAHANNESENDLHNRRHNEHMSMDDILLTKSEEDDDYDDLPSNGVAQNEPNNSNQQKWRQVSKRVSFQG